MQQLVTNERLQQRVEALRSGILSLREYHKTLQSRMNAVEYYIKAFVSEPTRWDRIDRERNALLSQTSTPKPPLYGVPIGVKDIMHATGFVTQAGADVPPAEITDTQATVVTRLREAGALVMGKTRTAEFAYFHPPRTRNPVDLEHTPGGSSSGSAAAVAAGLCPVALGTQTGGSITRPAAFCGIVGVKPSYDRIPTDGVLPLAPSVDHVGYFTQDIASAQLVGPVLYPNWQNNVNTDDLETIGVVDGTYLQQASDTAISHFERHVDQLQEHGYEVRRLSVFKDVEAINTRHRKLMAAEAALSHSHLYPRYKKQYASETAELIESGQNVDIATLTSAQNGRHQLRTQLNTTFDEHALDIIISPAAPGPAPKGIDSTGDPIMNLPWTHSGLPTVTLPASTTSAGLPIGLQCAAPFGSDEQLLQHTAQLESVLDHNRLV